MLLNYKTPRASPYSKEPCQQGDTVKLDENTPPPISPSMTVDEELRSFFTEDVAWDDLEWWSEHPYETSLGGRVSPWRRVPELQRQLFSADAPTSDGRAAAELHELQSSLRRFRETLNSTVEGEAPRSAEASSPPLGEDVSSGVESATSPPAPTSRWASWSRQRRLLVGTASCAGVLSLAATISQLVPQERIGLEVFDRPQIVADMADMTRMGALRIGDSSDLTPGSTRLLTEIAGFRLYGARTTEGDVCFMVETDREGSARCVPQSEFEDQGISDDLTGYIPEEDQPPGFDNGDVLHIEWTNQAPLTVEPAAG